MQKLRLELRKNQGLISKLVILVYRFGNFVYYKVKIPVIKHILLFVYKILDLIFVKIIANADIPEKTKIGYGLTLKHGAKCVVIHPLAIIGDNATIYHQVTIGIKGEHLKGLSPVIGDNAYIGAGAKILGPITIGDNVTVGANSVVVNDVPSGKIAVGIPARIKAHTTA